MSAIQAAARSVGQEIVILNIRTGEEIDAAFATAATRRVGALLVDGSISPLFSNRQIAALAGRYAIPAIYPNRGFPSPAIETAMVWPRWLDNQPAHRWLRDIIVAAGRDLQSK